MKTGMVFLGVLIFLCLFLPGAARACAILEKAQPRVGSTVSGAVAAVTLTFSMEVFPKDSTIEVRDAAGKLLNVGQAYGGPGDKDVIATKLKPLPPGKYRVHWDVLAACGSKEPGNYKFTVVP